MVINKATMMEKQADGTFRNVGEIVPNIDQRVRDLEGSKSSTEESLTSIKGSIESLATVATSGNYSDLEGTPSLVAVATSGSYNDLTDKPNLSAVATSGNYGDLSGRPSLTAVATSGSYNDLTDKPSLSAVATSGNYSDLEGIPSLATVATTGSYNDLTDKPSIPSSVSYTVSQKGTRTSSGDWTITGLTPYKPLFIISKSPQCTVVLESGTTTDFYVDDGTFTLGYNGYDGALDNGIVASTNVMVVIPVSSSVVIAVDSRESKELYAYQ